MLCLAMLVHTSHAQTKEYTGDPVTFINDDGYQGKGWFPGKYYIKMDGKSYGYYVSQGAKGVVKETPFDAKKYSKKNSHKTSSVESFNGILFNNAGQEIGKFQIRGMQGQFTFYEPYKVKYIKGINGRKMAEQLIDEGFLTAN